MEEIVSALETDLESAQKTLAIKQNIILTLSDQLRRMKYPRHFISIAELTDWLQKDDTDTKDELPIQLALILQRRALMDGYLLPVSFYWQEGELRVINMAVFGRNIYGIRAIDDTLEFYFFSGVTPPLIP
ncbi:TPA: hypothetical protein DD712_04165 [Candidatus Acetothermia bacterium]|nr:hypothetical protein [Candidatus Acetothermia bacterium]